MGTFTRNTVTKGKYKGIVATEDGFMDDETGEAIDLAKQLHEVYGDYPFELVTSYKTDEDV